jgi:hypothetical protein
LNPTRSFERLSTLISHPAIQLPRITFPNAIGYWCLLEFILHQSDSNIFSHIAGINVGVSIAPSPIRYTVAAVLQKLSMTPKETLYVTNLPRCPTSGPLP